MWRRSVPRLVAAASTPAAALRPRVACVPELARHLSALSVDVEATNKRRDVFYDRIARKLADMQSAPVSMEVLSSTVQFLERHGLSKDRALSAISRHPMIIHYSTEMMEEKIRGLHALGLHGPMLSAMIGRHPNILGVRTETIMAIRDWYVMQGVNASKVPFLLAVFPQAVSLSIRDNLNPKIEVLRGAGLSSAHLVRILQRTPQILTLSIDRMQSQVMYLRLLGLSQVEVAKLLVLVPECLSLSTDNIDAKLQLLDELFGPGAGVTALSVNPRILMRNSAELRRSFLFLTEEVGFDASRLANNIALIMRTVDGILKPRYEFLDRSVPHYAFDTTWWITAANEQFAEKFPEYTAFLETYGKSDA